MALKDLLIGALSWFAGGAAEPAAKPLREAYGTTIDPDEDQWRKLTGDAQRDLTPLDQARMQKIALFLWERNLLANRLVELPVAFLLAEGVRLQVDDKENQKVLDRFWRDPINDMDLKLPKKARELSIFGEQCYPAFVNPVDGVVRIGYLDPALIETVVMDPDNPEQPIGVVTCKDKKGRARRYRVIINGDESVFTARTQAIRETFTDGDAFYFRVNDLSSGRRGRSDLLPQADWLDEYDSFLFGEAERYNFLRAFIWDITLKNATEEKVEQRAREITSPKPGSVRVHNDSEVWEELTPKLQAGDTSEGARMLRNHVLGGATMPEHWFGGGGDVNRAAAAEMEAPTMKVYTMRQKVLKHMLESIGRYVLFQDAKADGQKVDWSDPKYAVQAIFPELSQKDLTKQAAALAQVAAACASLVTQNLLSRKSAVSLIAAIASKLGLEIDPDEELKRAEAEGLERAKNDLYRGAPGDGDRDGVVAESMQEAVDLIHAWGDKAEATLEQLRGDAQARGLERFTEALEHQAEAGARLAEALGKQLQESNAQLIERVVKELGEGQTRIARALSASRSRTVEMPDGRTFRLKEEVTK